MSVITDDNSLESEDDWMLSTDIWNRHILVWKLNEIPSYKIQILILYVVKHVKT